MDSTRHIDKHPVTKVIGPTSTTAGAYANRKSTSPSRSYQNHQNLPTPQTWFNQDSSIASIAGACYSDTSLSNAQTMVRRVILCQSLGWAVVHHAQAKVRGTVALPKRMVTCPHFSDPALPNRDVPLRPLPLVGQKSSMVSEPLRRFPMLYWSNRLEKKRRMELKSRRTRPCTSWRPGAGR